ncbi:MAG TPA: hypothetical protein PKG63_08820 [Bacteroidales bacterium]|jgi:hypothetical protein|nr:hypothetical protein [Bacteroidales bacterium]HNV96563.1 hypothetical protein [Bacteroidales bacterium]HOU98617.1 hypothetical protein [Bacteroidales bacterium]
MKRVFIYLIFCTLTLHALAHPVHITITNIEPNASKACFEVAIKVFTDDLEHGIVQQLNKNIGLIAKSPSSDINELFLLYINNHFKILINGKAITSSKIKFIKYSIVDDATWLYFEYKISSKINQLSVYNDLLNHLYPDMTNLVIIKWNQQEQGLTFTKNKTELSVL